VEQACGRSLADRHYRTIMATVSKIAAALSVTARAYATDKISLDGS